MTAERDMERLRCGVIVMGSFRQHLEGFHAAGAAANPGSLPCIDYVRCREGKQAGSAFWNLRWYCRADVKEFEIFRIGKVEVYIPKSARFGLKDRYIKCVNGKVFVG
jgi:hypothetical protein